MEAFDTLMIEWESQSIIHKA